MMGKKSRPISSDVSDTSTHTVLIHPGSPREERLKPWGQASDEDICTGNRSSTSLTCARLFRIFTYLDSTVECTFELGVEKKESTKHTNGKEESPDANCLSSTQKARLST